MIAESARDRDRAHLHKLMKKYKLTSPMVAKLIGVQTQTVRMWRCGLRPVPAYALKIINLTHGQ
jgi:DNA-binding transcriptional regulator YiaG